MAEDVKIRQIALARVLLDDIASLRLAPQPLLIKSKRLARLVNAHEIVTWLGWEIGGYAADSGLAVKYIEKTGRLVDAQRLSFYQQPFVEIDGQVRSSQLERCGSEAGRGRVVDLEFAQEIAKLAHIRTRVLTMLHEFVGATYCTLVFERLLETMIEQGQECADQLLPQSAGSPLRHIPAIYHELSAGDRAELIEALAKVWNAHPPAWRLVSRPSAAQRPEVSPPARPSPEPQVALAQLFAHLSRVVSPLVLPAINPSAAPLT